MTRPLVGLLSLLVAAALVCASGLTYRHALPWQRGIEVTLTTPSAGLQLNPPADVKLDGLVVGQVRRVTTTGRQAVLHLSLDPSRIGLLPADVDATLVPKTLFGEKYVALHLPATTTSRRLAAGDRIVQSAAAVETDRLFADLGPVLDTLQPAQLSLTLQALASALDGNGARLGQTLARVHTYLSAFAPHVPALVEDLRRLGETSELYAHDAAALFQVADDSRAISSELLVRHADALGTFLSSLERMAGTTTATLRTDGERLVALSSGSTGVLRLLDTYASSFPCTIHGLSVLNSVADHIVAGDAPYVRVTLDVGSQQGRGYDAPGDLPRAPGSDANNDMLPDMVTTWAPHCGQVPWYAEGVADEPVLSGASR